MVIKEQELSSHLLFAPIISRRRATEVTRSIIVELSELGHEVGVLSLTTADKVLDSLNVITGSVF